MTTPHGSTGIANLLPWRLSGRVLSLFLFLGLLASASAQNSSLSIKMVPVTLMLPQLQLAAPQGSTNVLEVSTNLSAWQDVTTLVFASTNLLWVDLYPRGTAAYYRMRRVAPGSLPPFPAPRTNLVWIPPGQFLLGSPASDADAEGDEGPQTPVTLTKGFFISKYEFTQADYLEMTGSNHVSFRGDYQLPVDSVNWQQATNICGLLNLKEAGLGRLPAGYTYRLPTEAEWEYAARAGSTNRFSWGNDNNFSQLSNYAWYVESPISGPQPVGEKLPNAWGLYDTAGNVCEWSIDSASAYPGDEITDPAPNLAAGTKVFRGGSYSDEAARCRPADRRDIAPTTQPLDIFGLRVVLVSTAP